MKNKLLRYPKTVEIEGAEYSINTDFSVWIEIEQIFLSRDMSCEVRFAKILALAFPKLPSNPNAALDKILWFYSCGKDDSMKVENDVPSAPAYDLKKDFEYVYAGFLKEFGINLLIEDLHWWQFKMLLSCLGDDCKFSKIVGYRCTDTSKIKNREMRSFLEKMKKKYRLPDIRTDEERELETALKMDSLFG